jgi:hypothetical protein
MGANSGETIRQPSGLGVPAQSDTSPYTDRKSHLRSAR